MGWRPSSWWARSQDRQPDADPRPPSSPRPAAESSPAAWRDLPILTPTSATPVQRVAVRDDFAAGLASHSDPRFLQRLTHLVDPSIGGLVDGLALPGVPHDRDVGPELAVPHRPSKPTPRVQRQVTWSGVEELPTVRWEMPDAVSPDQLGKPSADDLPAPEKAVGDQPLISTPPSDSSPPAVLPVPSARPTAPVLQRAVAVDPPRSPRAEPPATLQRALFAAIESARTPPPAVVPADTPTAAPTIAEAPVAQPCDLDHQGAERSTDSDHDHDHGQLEVRSDASTSGWTEVALPLAPSAQTAAEHPSLVQTTSALQRSVTGETAGRKPATAKPSPSARASSPSVPVQTLPVRTAPIQPVPGQPVPRQPVPEQPETTPAPLQPPLVQRSVGVSIGSTPADPTPADPTPADPTPADPTPTQPTRPSHAGLVMHQATVADWATPTDRAGSAQRATVVGVPLVQRNADAAPLLQSTRESSAASGVAMSFASMFSAPATSTLGDQPGPGRALVSRSVIEAPPIGAHGLPTSPAPPVGEAAATQPIVQTLTGAPQFSSTTARADSSPALPVQRPPAASSGQAPQSQHWLRPTAVSMPMAPLQRQTFDDTPSSDQPPANAPEPSPSEQAEPSTPAAPTETAPTITAGGPAAGPAPGADLDEMARRLYEPLVARIRAELWLDRERAGVFGDG